MSAYIAELDCLCPRLCALSALLVGACHVCYRAFVTRTCVSLRSLLALEWAVLTLYFCQAKM